MEMSTPQEPINEPGDGVNPAWNDVLSVIPSEFHDQVIPHFKTWDESANSRITDLNSKVESFNPYAPLVEHGIDIETVHTALNMFHEVNNNPQAIRDALLKAYPIEEIVSAVNGEGGGDLQYQTDPRIKEQVDLLSSLYIQEQEAKQQAAEDAKLDKALGDAINKHPDLQWSQDAETYVLSLMMNNAVSAEQAVQSFVDFRNSLAPAPFAPKIMGGGGGLPSQQIDPRKLDSNQTKSLIVQMLEANAAEKLNNR